MTTETQTQTKVKLATPWQVVVFDDPVNLMEYVTQVFIKVFQYPRGKAEKHMMEVHKNGKSVLWTGERERAEMYVYQLQAFQLQATLERSE